MTPRVEYGAQLVSASAAVYVKDTTLQVVTDWIASMAGVTPIRLVSRICDGDTCGRWDTVPTSTTTTQQPKEMA